LTSSDFNTLASAALEGFDCAVSFALSVCPEAGLSRRKRELRAKTTRKAEKGIECADMIWMLLMNCISKHNFISN
jgi:hypothetical protein